MRLRTLMLLSFFTASAFAQPAPLNAELGTPILTEARSFKFVSLDSRIKLADYRVRVYQTCRCKGDPTPTEHFLNLKSEGSVEVPRVYSISKRGIEQGSHLSIQLVSSSPEKKKLLGFDFEGTLLGEDYRDFGGAVKMFFLDAASIGLTIDGMPLPVFGKNKEINMGIVMPMEYSSDFNQGKLWFHSDDEKGNVPFSPRPKFESLVVAFQGDQSKQHILLTGGLVEFDISWKEKSKFVGLVHLSLNSNALKNLGAIDLKQKN